MLTIALPKGRIAEDTLEIFRNIFGSSFMFEDRKLILEEGNFRFLMVRNQDIPTYVTEGAADIGVVGLDVLEEHKPNVVRLLDLQIGKCKVCIGIKNEDELDFSRSELKIATKMPNITRNYFAKLAVGVKIIKLYGSIELAPLVGLSDAIVDVVETGSTMKQNGLKVAGDIMQSSAYLIANKNSFIIKKDEILELYQKIKDEISNEISLASSVFYTDTTKEILQKFGPGGHGQEWKFFNIDKTRRVGFEIGLKERIFDVLDFTQSYSFVDAKIGYAVPFRENPIFEGFTLRLAINCFGK